jgi:hypothetical protein
MLAFCIHLIAGAAMALILRNGLETNASFQDRLRFLVDDGELWTFGWLTWTGASVAILYFYLEFATAHETGHLPVLLTAAGIAADISGQAIEIGILPAIAERVVVTNVGSDLFNAFHRTAVMMSGFAANGLYSVSAIVLAWSARKTYPGWISAAGIATGCFGLCLSAAALADSVAGMVATNVLLIPCLLLWLAGVARHNYPIT